MSHHHPDAIEEEAYAFSRMFPDHDGWARMDGHCCATFARGGDCAHSMAGWTPDEDETAYARDGAGKWVEVGSPCSVDGRPVAPEVSYE